MFHLGKDHEFGSTNPENFDLLNLICLFGGLSAIPD